MVKIYILELSSPICDEDKSFFLSKLNNSERKTLPTPRGHNFELSLIGKVLAKKIISDETLTSIRSIIIGKTKLGKPLIKKPNVNLDISISHSHNYLVVGICDYGKIGVDIEALVEVDLGALRRCLSTSEEIYIDSGNGRGQKLNKFYEIWTRKEAYLKALGIGLQKPMPITEFYPDHTKPGTKMRHNKEQFYISTLKKTNFVLSVCSTSSIFYNLNYKKLTLDKLLYSINNQKTISSE